jgi:hypothetical protein
VNADVQRLIDLAQSERIITADEAQKLVGFLERKQGDLDAAASYLVRFHNVDPQLADGLKARAAADATSGAAPPPPRRASSRRFAEVQAPPPLVAAPAQPAGGLLALKVAGGILIANALIVFASMAVLKEAPGAHAGLSSSPISGIIDILIGGSLLTGNLKYRSWAIVRVALGTLLFCGLALAQGDAITFGLQAIFSGSLIALLVGEAGMGRVVAGGLGAGLCLLLELVAVLALASGKPLFRGAVVQGKLEEISGVTVKGEAFPYKLRSPGRGWKVRRSEDAHKDNAACDRWLVQEKLDAHICVYGTHLDVPPGKLDVERLQKGVLDGMQGKFTAVKVLDEAPLGGAWDGAKLIHLLASSEGQEIEWLYGMFIKDSTIYQVQAFAPRSAYKDVAADFKRVITNFEVE